MKQQQAEQKEPLRVFSRWNWMFSGTDLKSVPFRTTKPLFSCCGEFGRRDLLRVPLR